MSSGINTSASNQNDVKNYLHLIEKVYATNLDQYLFEPNDEWDERMMEGWIRNLVIHRGLATSDEVANMTMDDMKSCLYLFADMTFNGDSVNVIVKPLAPIPHTLTGII